MLFYPTNYPCCRMYAMTLLMFDSPFEPPCCAQFALVSAASFPSCPECPFTLDQPDLQGMAGWCDGWGAALGGSGGSPGWAAQRWREGELVNAREGVYRHYSPNRPSWHR